MNQLIIGIDGKGTICSLNKEPTAFPGRDKIGSCLTCGSRSSDPAATKNKEMI
ncbi:hypothetical protein KJ966_00145 [bacterium]|nr:hypothetical protein [bacterium]